MSLLLLTKGGRMGAAHDPLVPSWEVPAFAGCSGEELALVARAAEEYRARPGEVLVREGRTGRELFLVADGVAEVSANGEVIGTVGRGESFGAIASGGRRITVTALSPMRLLVLGPREFAGLISRVGPLRRLLRGRQDERLLGNADGPGAVGQL